MGLSVRTMPRTVDTFKPFLRHANTSSKHRSCAPKRISIQDAASEVVDSDVRSISVRDMKEGVTIATPEVMRTRNAREFRTLADAAAVPVASREFSRAETLADPFRAYGPGETAPSVSAELLSGLGGAMCCLSIVRAHATGDVYEIDAPLASLAAGDYLVEVSAVTISGNATDVVDFKVTT